MPEANSEAQRPSAQEFWLLKLLLLHGELVDWCASNLEVDWIQHAVARQIIALRLKERGETDWRGLGAFLDDCNTPEMRNLVTEAATEERPIPNPAQQLADVALRLRNQFIDRQVMTLIQRANQPEADDTARVDLMRQQQQLRQMKRKAIPPPTA